MSVVEVGWGAVTIILGAAAVEFLVSLGIASLDVTQDICVSPCGAARFTAEISSTSSDCSQRPGHWRAGHLVIDLVLGSRVLLPYQGPGASITTNAEAIGQMQL